MCYVTRTFCEEMFYLVTGHRTRLSPYLAYQRLCIAAYLEPCFKGAAGGWCLQLIDTLHFYFRRIARKYYQQTTDWKMTENDGRAKDRLRTEAVRNAWKHHER